MRTLTPSIRPLLGTGGLTTLAALLLAGCASGSNPTAKPEAQAGTQADSQAAKDFRAPAEAATGSRIARRGNKTINTQTLNKDAVREAADAVQGAATGSSGTR